MDRPEEIWVEKMYEKSKMCEKSSKKLDFVLHQNRTIPRKGFEIGFCKEVWCDFPWRRPFREDLSAVVTWKAHVSSLEMVQKAYRRG